MQSALSRASRLLWLVAAVAVAALPGTARWQLLDGVSASRGESQAIHASAWSLARVAERATIQITSQRRSTVGTDAALAADGFPTTIANVAIERASSPDRRGAAARLSARGYDATAPPLD